MSKRYKMATPPDGWEWVFDQSELGRRHDKFVLVRSGESYEEFDLFYPSGSLIGWEPKLIAKRSKEIVKRLRRRIRKNRKYPPDLDGYTFVPHLDPNSAAASAAQAEKAGDVAGRAEA